MDDSTSQKIAELLNDPETLGRIASVVSGLTKGAETASAAPPAPVKPQIPPPAASNDRTALLRALKPLLRDDKQQKIDKLINALAVAAVVKNLKGDKGGSDNVQQ